MRIYEFETVTKPSFDTLERVVNDEDPDFNIKIPKPITVDSSGDVWDYAEGMPCDRQTDVEQRAIRGEIANSTPSIEDIPHNIMITGQDYVSSEGLKQYLENPSGQLPLIYVHNGKHVVLDGNHRIVVDILRGKTSTKCRVKYVDKWIDPDGCFKT